LGDPVAWAVPGLSQETGYPRITVIGAEGLYSQNVRRHNEVGRLFQGEFVMAGIGRKSPGKISRQETGRGRGHGCRM